MLRQWVDHSSHPHRLYFDGDTVDTFVCSICGETGAKQQYKCTDRDSGCDYRLHTVCAQVISEIKPLVYGDRHIFKFHAKPKKNDRCYCVACGKGIKGVSYYCGPKKLYLHLYCNWEFKLEITVNNVSLKLTETIRRCQHCERREYKGVKFKTWAYVSDCGRYRYFAACILDARVTRYKEALKNQRNSISDSLVTHHVALNRRSASTSSASHISHNLLNNQNGSTSSGSRVSHNMHHGRNHQMLDVIISAIDLFNALVREVTGLPF